jgi:hypothetical protein
VLRFTRSEVWRNPGQGIGEVIGCAKALEQQA